MRRRPTLAALMAALSLGTAAAGEVEPVELDGIAFNDAALTVVGPDGEKTYTPAELEEFGTYRMVTATPWRDEPAVFEGPLLGDLLEAHGLADLPAIRVTAENDYSVVVPREVWTGRPVMVATRVDGKAHRRRARAAAVRVFDGRRARARRPGIRGELGLDGGAHRARRMMGRLRRAATLRDADVREQWSTLGALFGILALLLGGGYYVERKLSEVRAEIPLIEATKLRDGFIALGDLIRLEDAVNAATAMPEIDAEALEAVSRALDFIFVRSQQFGKLSAGDGVPDDSAAIEAPLLRIVEAGDRALAGDAAALRRFDSVLEEQAAAFRTQLVHYVDAQHQTQLAAIAEQARILKHMTVSTAVLLLVFGLVSSVAVLLLRAEQRANRRRRAAEEQARFLAYHDPLTGLLNRTRFHEIGGTILDGGQDPLVLLLDLDQFKSINDSHGHAAGDAVLTAVAERLQRHAAERDGVAARLGGDELAAIMTGPFSRDEAADAARSLLADLRAPVHFDGAVLSPDASIGLCRSTDLAPGVVPGVSAMLKAADIALYEAKERDFVDIVQHDPELAARAAERQGIRTALPKAVENGEVFAVFQPQVDLASGCIRGVEALARWRRDDEVLLPERFIPVAEDSGQIVAIDRLILREATATVARWVADGLGDISLSVNLSALNLRDDSIVEEVRDALLKSGLPPDRLVLEITETAVLESTDKARRTIARLHEIGVAVALDDFGTGYSTLGSLKELSIDAVKIDRSFLARLDDGDEAEIILRALSGMAHRLGLSVTIEGIETEAQRTLARSLGCDTVQGFLYDRPMEAHRILARFASAETGRCRGGRGN